MARKKRNAGVGRREFFKTVAGGGVLLGGAEPSAGSAQQDPSGSLERAGRTESPAPRGRSRIEFPRSFTGRNLAMIAFPLGGIGTGTVSLGGRGQLRDWELFNRPDKGNSPGYAFPAIWVQLGKAKPVTRVLESRLQPPYQGQDGLTPRTVPGLPRFENATFTGGYPLARVDFQDNRVPVRVSLEAFNPLVPLDTEASGLPCAVLRYRIQNPAASPAKVGVAFSLQNMVGDKGKQAAFREEAGLAGLFMDNPFLPATDPLKGSMVLGVLGAEAGAISHLRGWKRARWWDGALTFWDDFSEDGILSSDGPAVNPVSSIAVTQVIPPRGEASATFLITWHFPNRTPKRCRWAAVEGEEETIIGNHYCQKYSDAWAVARHLAHNLDSLETRTRQFITTIASSTLPAPALDAALSNLSTLRTNTAFRTADGEFHGFEGSNDQTGCCYGTCTHVWNYEQATAFMFPSLSRSIRESEFLRNTAENGQMAFRRYLPDGKKIWDHVATDGQFGCLMKLYRDWQLSGDSEWLRRLWPQARKALEFAWIKGGWDEDRDGVAEGVQHNTYDVEFFGPNPLCGIWYLGALRAGEEMARALGDSAAALEYRRLFDNGRKWIDANLFNGEYYVQKVVGRAADAIAPGLTGGAGAPDPHNPDYQMGEACLVDQLLGQYMAHICGLGYLVDEDHIRQTLRSILKYNYRPTLSEHEAVQRIYALNDEAGVVVASYPLGKRPAIPFPYFAEVWSGLEYQLAAHLMFEGMPAEALRVVESVRRRHDGERRNPWNEPECGHHYSRAMSSWALLVALNGFHYSAVERALTLRPITRTGDVRGFWTVPSGWGSFSQASRARTHRTEIRPSEGDIAIERLALADTTKSGVTKVFARVGSDSVAVTLRTQDNAVFVLFERAVQATPQRPLVVETRG